MMKRTQAYFSSDNRISKIFTLIWTPETETLRGVVQITPSFGEHIARYDEFASFLAENGFVVCGADHVGHGGSVTAPEELGAVNDDAHLTVVRDMDTLQRIMHKRYPDLPYFLLGAGVGSFAARIYAGAFPQKLTGAVFMGTSQIPDFVWALSDPLQALLERLPANLSSAAAPDVLFGKLTMRLYKDNSELSWLSVNEENLIEYITDPCTGFPMTRQLTDAMLQLMLRGSHEKNANALPPEFPVLFVSGAKDSFGFFGRGVIRASDLYAAAGLAPEVILYPTDRHEILHEDDRERVFGDILRFLDSAIQQ